MTVPPEVRENAPAHRFEIWVGDEMAGQTVYQSQGHGQGQTLPFVHTEIDDRFGGQGLGSILIREALNTVRARGVMVLPYCPFVRRYIEKHPEYLELVPRDHRTEFGLPEESAA